MERDNLTTERINLNNLFEKEASGGTGKSDDLSQSEEPTWPGEQQHVDTNSPANAPGEMGPAPDIQKQPEITMCPIDQIKVPKNRGEANQENVDNLKPSIEMTGLINPITVNKDIELIAGRDRLEACRQAGMKEVPVIIVNVPPRIARMMEICENYCRRAQTTLERAEGITEWKALDQEAHPKAKQGGDRRSKTAKSNRQNEDLKRFSVDTAKKIGASESKVQRLVQIGTNITPEVKDMIRNTWIANSQTDLLMLAAYSPEQQKTIAQEIVAGNGDSVREIIEKLAQHDAKKKSKGITPVKKGKPTKVPSKPAAKGATEDQVSPATTGEALKGTTAVEPEPPAQPPPSEAKSDADEDVILDEEAKGEQSTPVPKVGATEVDDVKKTPDHDLPKWAQELIVVMRGKKTWEYVLLVNKFDRPNGSKWPKNTNVGAMVKVFLRADGGQESVEFSCKATDDQTACFIAEEVNWGRKG